MRIQHNIMAMSAYRNYTNNVSAMQKNLEKLSSGYKINRAGDDAAGLAISEKMRAQISGLEAAQKNAKDGISLVQTAEGALTEVHDMLNRMVTLATQSANGTYDNNTDRYQLQKEMDQLRDEINRISKASNFNGIQLLNGEMDQGGRSTTGGISIATEGTTLGANTLLRTPATSASTAEFTLDLDTLTWNAKTGDKLEISLGTDKITLTAAADETYTASELATAIKTQFEDAGGNNGKLGTIDADVSVEGTSVTFKAKAAGTADAFAVDRDVTLKLTPADGSKPVMMNDIQTFEEGDDKKLTVDGTAGNKIEVKAAQGGANATYTVDVSGKDKDGLNGKKIDGVAITWDDSEGGDLASTMAAFVETYNKTAGKEYTASYASNTLTLTANEKKEITTKPQTDISGSDADMTQGTAGAAPTSPAVTLDATGLDKEKILAAASGAADGDKITISLNTTDKKLELKVGNTVVGTSDAIADSNSETEFTFKTADETPVTLGKVTFSAAPTNADTISGIETGLSIKEDDGNQDITGSGGVGFGGEGGMTVTAGSDLEKALTKLGAGGDGKVDTTQALTSDEVTALKTAFPTTGAGTTTTVTVSGGSGESAINEALTVDLGAAMDSLKDGAKVSDLVNALKEAGNKAIADWEKAPANADKTYTFELQWIATDAAGANKLYDATNASSLALPSGVDGLYYSYKQVEKQSGDPVSSEALSGNFNAATTNNVKGADAAAGKYASTTFNLSAVFGSSIGDGSTITIAGSEYTFKLGDSFKVDGTTITLDKKLTGDALFEQAGEGLSLMDNTNFSIGHEGKGKIVLDERPTSSTDVQAKLTSKPDFESLLSYKSVSTKDETKGLVLQIGDTAEDFNQIKVSIGACDTKSLGIDGIDISKQESAQTAIDAIKAAINYVSDVRGTLGATQNRLDHTINNLSVMTENIQDAESTIRDVDVAEEMMAYTKNNILIQSAQAMLAQANQVPQGVLQLLG